MQTGEEQAWKDLSERDPDEVCERASAHFSAGTYELPFLGQPILVSPENSRLSCETPDGELLLTSLGYFSRLSILHYLLCADGAEPSGRWIKPSDIGGTGNAYFQGSHLLPLDAVAARFSHDGGGFEALYRRFGGERANYGDVAMQLPVFPLMPALMILWEGDDEFPPRADLLFDETCGRFLPLDVVWSIAMVVVLPALKA